jgi:type IV conjugative transfer system lipoprotein TraV
MNIKGKIMVHRYQHLIDFNKILFTFACLLLSGCSMTPYSSDFKCSDTYNGICEPVENAYKDSVNGINPADYDEKYQQKRKKWEDNHKNLLLARKQKEAEKKAMINDMSGENISYREVLFKQYKNYLKEPAAPVVIPPKPMRILILDSASKDKNIYTTPHYVYFLLDRPKWILKKIHELKSGPKGKDDYAEEVKDIIKNQPVLPGVNEGDTNKELMEIINLSEDEK